MLSPLHVRQWPLQSGERFLHTLIEMTQHIILRFCRLLVITAAVKQVIPPASKIQIHTGHPECYESKGIHYRKHRRIIVYC